jgi:hypothetical protein
MIYMGLSIAIYWAFESVANPNLSYKSSVIISESFT